MSRLATANIECVDSQDNFAHFHVEPLEKGFGVTLGNALRRVLLGYLPGAVVTRVKIEGIQHEFSTIPFVKEDVTEFLLNIKALRLKSLSEQPGKLMLEVEGEKRVTAADIAASTDFEVANPELYLATLDSPEAKLSVELDVELGEGYREAESGDNMPVGTIPIDAVFTPVRKVNFNVEPVHVSREMRRERLDMEVWTDGTITPVEAISRGAQIIVDQLMPFIDYAKVSRLEEEKEMIRASISEEKYDMPVEQLDLSVRTMNCLRRGGIATVGELISRGEKGLLALHNFGQKSRQEVEEKLTSMGLSMASAVKEGESEEAD